MALSIKMRRRIPLDDDVEALEDDRESPGLTAVGASNGTLSFLPLPLVYASGVSSMAKSGVLDSPPRTARACPMAVAALGMFNAALAGASRS